jgi:hypothetical protein
MEHAYMHIKIAILSMHFFCYLKLYVYVFSSKNITSGVMLACSFRASTISMSRPWSVKAEIHD